ncbi:hypothetical protein HWX16_21050 [Ochrobactrum intermedium]|uniref:hypothetical protein n=1 Tax=Brucella intermedia TaxID=94625 RepID=UPI00159C53F5|nr:hypothetical protein [Brucella intermedia]NVM42804.1 hypothetical protein [Brucella intermedia]
MTQKYELLTKGYVCDGCGRLARDPHDDIQRLNDGGFLSCCPERRMMPVVSQHQSEQLLAEQDKTITALEKLRPHWAQGYSSDSIAAQTAVAALSQLWGIIGASNQTEAVEKAKGIVADLAANTARIEVMEHALRWYEEHVSNCRKIGSVGAPSRAKLDRDGGEKARAALKAEAERIGFLSVEDINRVLGVTPLGAAEQMKMTPEYIEKLIDETGRAEVFAKARKLGWSIGGAPLFVWNVICQDIQRDRMKVREVKI